MKVSKLKDNTVYQQMMELIRIGNKGREQTLAKNKRLGFPNEFSINGTLCFQLPDGTITTRSPFKKLKSKKKN
ncbi:MAG: hypothetical protein JNL47_06050 [Bacteroidia bacterium]|nr:hypothetical protein [Bacteroidia bacterium]